MVFHYMGKFDGDESKLPQKEHHPGYVPFKEAEDMKKMSLAVNGGCVLTIIVLAIPFFILGKQYIPANVIRMSIGGMLTLAALFPHELLHAVCFKKDVYMYTNLAQGLLFVVGTEDMSRRRFIFMSLCPNIVLGVIPYVLFLIFPHLTGLGVFGTICTGMGFGDYINVYNALTQMPKDAKTYLSGMHSYWYK